MDADAVVSWVQYGTTVGLGVASIVLKNLWARIDKVEARIDKVEGRWEAQLREHRDKSERDEQQTWEAIDRLRESMDQDRKVASTDRANIAATMVTRNELDRQFNRLIDAFTMNARSRREDGREGAD